VQARATWRTDEAAGVGGIAPERLVFIDESAVLTSMVRRYGRSPRGQRAYAKVPFGNWKRLSVLSALGIEGVLATMSIDDATDGDTFAAYLEQVLLPVLRVRSRLRPGRVRPVWRVSKARFCPCCGFQNPWYADRASEVHYAARC